MGDLFRDGRCVCGDRAVTQKLFYALQWQSELCRTGVFDETINLSHRAIARYLAGL
jgi:hypothetical protein